MTAGIVHTVLFLVGAPIAGVIAVAAWDAHRKRQRDGEGCVCGHTRIAHQHYRLGDECAHCDCPGFLSAVRTVAKLGFDLTRQATR